ncbi:MAG: recombinase family protein [Deltaproteobacteria bacterium]|nr:recombinase family protein [Deltaproteobacteria bacterium]
MSKMIGYIRVSTDRQTTENQRLAILEYCSRADVQVDEWISVEASSRRTATERRIDELLSRVGAGDRVIVSELSRLGRSVGQIAILVQELLQAGVRLVCIKEGIDLNDKPDIQAKVMVTMFSLFAEIDRDLISERTKEGLARAQAQGKLLGRPKGLGKSKLDKHQARIRELLELGVPKTRIAARFKTTPANLAHWLKRRRIK